MEAIGRRRPATGHSRAGCAALAVAALALGCATTPRGGSLDERIADQPSRFEDPPVESASDLWPERWVRGEGWEVEAEVATDGFRRVYRVRSDWGDFEARGDDELRERLQEIQAIKALEETSRSQEFAKAVGRALATPFVASWNLITRPVSTITGVPVGVMRFLARPVDAARSERGELEPSAAEDLIGFGATKRELAYWLEVDPYTSNEALQRELNRVAWTIYAGQFPFQLVPFAKLDKVSTQIDAIDRPFLDASARERLRLDTPEELRDANRKRLDRMGVPAEIRDEFLAHPWYSPRHHVAILESLEAMSVTGDRALFFEVAVGAEDEDDARFTTETAELLRRVHQERVSIVRLVAIDGSLVGGFTADRELAVPLPVDIVSWTQPFAQIADTLRGVAGTENARGTQLLLTGELTERARAELGAREISSVEGAFGDTDRRR